MGLIATMSRSNRSTLHVNNLAEFKAFLASRSIATRPGKGEYQLFQVEYPGTNWNVVFFRLGTEHLTANKALMPIVEEFFNTRLTEK